ncbi:MerR family transcriptional regulator [Streptococcus agalactiae]|uniref:MerR family transcriptional regulator n=1 Tax=Streptococcus agalactiae TaxID=1311 RepID=UPI003C70D79B
MKTVKEISHISGISVRTLHYYDEIDLLPPSFVGENGYRYYDDESLIKLQEILLFKELEFPLKKIKEIMDSPNYDRNQALLDQIRWLEIKKQRLEEVIEHAKSIQRGRNMSDFTAYNQEELEAFQEEARTRWGNTDSYKEFENSDSKDDFSMISQDMSRIFKEFGQLKELSATDEKVQKQVQILQDYITAQFYNCTNDLLASLGIMYVQDERFQKSIDNWGGQGTALFVSKAIDSYCQ